MYRRVHEPEALDPRAAVWRGGRFDAGRRPFTARVEGVTRTADHLLLVTLSGGARRVEVVTDDRHRYEGPDRAGAVSFVPAFCERRLVLEDVEAEWASVALSPATLRIDEDDDEAAAGFAPFSNVEDPFVAAVVGELDRAHRLDGLLDPAYGETLSLALARYMAGRNRGFEKGASGSATVLPRWRLKRVRDYVEANIDRPIAIAELAEAAGHSAGHFHRAFRASTGQTPLCYLNERRVARALAILEASDAAVLDVAAAVGFESPSHFARVFRTVTGRRPSEARRG